MGEALGVPPHDFFDFGDPVAAAESLKYPTPIARRWPTSSICSPVIGEAIRTTTRLFVSLPSVFPGNFLAHIQASSPKLLLSSALLGVAWESGLQVFRECGELEAGQRPCR
jgi:hypothetical protein